MGNKTPAILISMIIVLILIFGGWTCSQSYGNVQENVKITVVDKERVNDGKSSKYLIFTKDEVFECTDSFLDGKWNSSDFYRKLKVGKTYTVKTRGTRIPFFSMYRNIVKIYN